MNKAQFKDRVKKSNTVMSYYENNQMVIKERKIDRGR